MDIKPDMNAVSQLPKPVLLNIIEFLFFSKVVEDADSLNNSIQSLSRQIFQNNNVKVILCGDGDNEFGYEQKVDDNINTKKVNTDTFSGDSNIICSNITGSNVTGSQERCSSLCCDSATDKQSSEKVTKSNKKTCAVEKNESSVALPSHNDISPEHLDETDDNKKFCLISSKEYYQNYQENINAFISLMPYVKDAFSRLTPRKAEDQEEKYKQDQLKLISLTPREKEVLLWVSRGKACWETGVIVGISERTVKFHLQNIYRKLNVVNRAQAITSAIKYNLI